MCVFVENICCVGKVKKRNVDKYGDIANNFVLERKKCFVVVEVMD